MKFMDEIKDAIKGNDTSSGAHTKTTHAPAPSLAPPPANFPANGQHAKNGYNPGYVNQQQQQDQMQMQIKHKDWPPIPKLRVQVADLSNAGAIAFFNNFHPTSLLKEAVIAVFTHLYTPDNYPKHVRSVTLIIEDFHGVANTIGTALDGDHKEIRLSTRHIESSKQRVKEEIRGVMVHEMVHCFQYNGKGTCPGGLVEGMADFVRLRSQLVPPHWKRGGSRWDEGYQTTGYFLNWIDGQYGDGTVRKLNDCMRQSFYDVDMFKGCCGGKDVNALWKEYKETC